MIELMIAAALAQPPAHCLAGPMPDVAVEGCPQWRLVRRHELGDDYVDPVTLRRSGAIVEVTLLTVANLAPRTLDARYVRFATRMRVDCAARTVQRVYGSQYDNNGRRYYWGAASYPEPEQGEGDWRYAGLLRDVCGRQALLESPR